MALKFAGAEPGRWIVDALAAAAGDPAVARTVAGQVPPVFEAYARIFHPARDADGRPVRWAAIARERGTTLHGEAQFSALAGLDEAGYPLSDDAWEGDPPAGDGLPQPDLAELAAVLAAHTTTPDDLYLALWNGYAFIHGGDAVSILAAEEGEDADTGEEAARQRRLEEEAKRPAFGPEVLGGPTLDLGGAGYRAYYLFSGNAGDLAHPLWKKGEAFEERQAPNMAWPADHAWMVSTELYEDTTVVGGSAALVRALADCPGLEVCTVSVDARLDADGDRTNPAPRLPGA
jgi:hypothetical protein